MGMQRLNQWLLCFFVYVCTGPSELLAGQVEALKSIGSNHLFNHVRILASDEFEGRAPGTPGEELTVQYLVSQFQKIGLQPGNPNDTYIQNVPLRGVTSDPTIALQAASSPFELAL